MFVRSGVNWTQQAYLKASNTGAVDLFGVSAAVSGDTIVIGAPLESSDATGVNGDQTNDNAYRSGAAYAFAGLGVGPHLAIERDGSGGLFIRFTGAPNATYRLQRAPTVNGPWSTSAPQTAPASGVVEFHDLFPPPGQAFYRAVQS